MRSFLLNPYLKDLDVVEEKKPGESVLPPDERVALKPPDDASAAQKAAYQLSVKRARAAAEARLAREEEEKKKLLAMGIKKRKVTPKEAILLKLAWPAYVYGSLAGVSIFIVGLLVFGVSPMAGMVGLGLGACVLGYSRSRNVAALKIFWREEQEHQFRLSHMTTINVLLMGAGLVLIARGIGSVSAELMPILMVMVAGSFTVALLVYASALAVNKNRDAASKQVPLAALLLALLSLVAWYFSAGMVIPIIILVGSLVLLLSSLMLTPLGTASMTNNKAIVVGLGVLGATLFILGDAVEHLAITPVVSSPRYSSLIPGGFSGSPKNLVFSPNGEKLAFAVSKEDGARIMVLSPAGKTLLREVEAGEEAGTPIFLGDDPERIAFDAVYEGQRDLYGVSLITGKGLRLTTRGVVKVEPGVRVYSKRDRRLYYLYHKEDRSEIRSVQSAGGGDKLVFGSPRFISSFSLSPDGMEIVYIEAAGKNRQRVWRYGIENKEVRLIGNNEEIPMSGHESKQTAKIKGIGSRFMAKFGFVSDPDATIKLGPPVFCTDGHLFALVEQKGNRFGIRILSRDGEYHRRVYLAHDGKVGSLAWTWKCDKIYFDTILKSPWQWNLVERINVVNVEEENVSVLLAKKSGYKAPALSPGSVSIAFASTDSLWLPGWGLSNVWLAVLR